MAQAGGYVRIAAAVPRLRVADCKHNAEQVLSLLERAERVQVGVVVFPELTLTTYTCADLFHQPVLLEAALTALDWLRLASAGVFTGLFAVGLPLVVDGQLFNCAAVLQRGTVLGVVPKTYLPNYGEFYEGRWFAGAARARSREVSLGDAVVPFGTDLLFEAADRSGLVVGVELCEDLWVPVPPSCRQALAGATVLANLSASNEVIGKAGYRKQLVLNQSGRCLAGYVYASSGSGESSTDLVFGGHCLLAENGSLLAESPRLRREESLLVADLDLDRLCRERIRTNSFGECGRDNDTGTFRRAAFVVDRPAWPSRLLRRVEAHPFVPQGEADLRGRCEEIFETQVAALVTRLECVGKPPVTIGISGGLDSTLALLVTCRTLDARASRATASGR